MLQVLHERGDRKPLRMLQPEESAFLKGYNRSDTVPCRAKAKHTFMKGSQRLMYDTIYQE